MTRFVLFAAALAMLCCAPAGAAENVCPNPDAEDPGANGQPAGWRVEGGAGTVWGDDQAHSGRRSLKIASQGGPTLSWVSAPIPVPRAGCRFALSVWAKLEKVTGKNGAAIGFYTFGEDGKRNGQTGYLAIGGAGDAVATTDWQQYFVISDPLPAEARSIGVNVRLYGASGAAWFDDVAVREFISEPLKQPRPLRRGIALRDAAVVCGKALQTQGEALRRVLKERGGVDVPVVADDAVDLPREKRDVFVLGSLENNRVAEALYLQSYTCEDRCFPGKGAHRGRFQKERTNPPRDCALARRTSPRRPERTGTLSEAYPNAPRPGGGCQCPISVAWRNGRAQLLSTCPT